MEEMPGEGVGREEAGVAGFAAVWRWNFRICSGRYGVFYSDGKDEEQREPRNKNNTAICSGSSSV